MMCGQIRIRTLDSMTGSFSINGHRTCATVLKPGIGTVSGLRDQIQASAPCERVLPPLVSTSRMDASLSSHSCVGLPSLKPGMPLGMMTDIVIGKGAGWDKFACQQAHPQRTTVDAGEI